jgi:hypothetical protein
MSRREKRLAIALMTVAVLILAGRYAKPVFIDPLFNTEQVRIAQRELDAVITEHDDREAELREKYEGYVQRTKSTKPDDVRDDLYDCISGLVRDAKLRRPVITPKEPRPIDKRSNVVTIQISMSAIGSFRQSIDFIRRFYRIPYIARFNSLKMEPTSARQRTGHDEVKLTGEIEVLVLPEEKLLDLKIGKQPDYIRKYAISKISDLNTWKPFTPYETPATPPPPPPPPPNDDFKTPSPPPPPPGPPQWDDGSEWLIRMVMRYGVDEVRLSNIVDESAMHVALGEEFDGGTLVLVSALGVVNFKEDFGYYVYPLGQYVSDAIALQDADEWPEIQVAMLQYFDAEDRRNAIEDAERKAHEAKRKAMGEITAGSDAADDFVGPPGEDNGREDSGEGDAGEGDAGREDDGVDSDVNSDGLVSAKSLLEKFGLGGDDGDAETNRADADSNGVESDGVESDGVESDGVESGGIESDLGDSGSVWPDPTSTGLRGQSKDQMQPTAVDGVKSNAGSKRSNVSKGRRTTRRSFRSRRTPTSQSATNESGTTDLGTNDLGTNEESISKSGKDRSDKSQSGSANRGRADQGDEAQDQTDPQ